MSKNKTILFFLMSQRLLNPKIKFLDQNTHAQTERHTDTRVNTEDTLSGIFPSIYHQGSLKQPQRKNLETNSYKKCSKDVGICNGRL